ncbi:MAG: hypothetical protein HY429_03515 [Candidatus Levybacteria bacterium]|nr:hypothetical protein [Candidatus Levybacteria bacterium]
MLLQQFSKAASCLAKKLFRKNTTAYSEAVFSWRDPPAVTVNKRNQYLLGIAIDLLCMFIVISASMKVTSTFISPLASPFSLLGNLNAQEKTLKFFSFIPGWTSTKFDNVDIDNADIFAFFDLPVLEDGTIDKENDGYSIFSSEQATLFFQHARESNKTVLATLTQTNTNEIEQFLDNPLAQETLALEAIFEIETKGINGVAIDFEYKGSNGQAYREKFVKFVKDLTDFVHARFPYATVTVALPTIASHNAFYDINLLATHADSIFVMAYDFAPLETQKGILTNPIYGYEKNDYWQKVSAVLNDFSLYIPKEKTVIETAWYGNGDKYPFSRSKENIDRLRLANTLKTPLSQMTIERVSRVVPLQARAAAIKNVPFIVKALEDENILDPNILAYALATIEHETAGTFEPIEEFKGRKNARRLGYEGGTNYFGRGFIQLTHLRNYKTMGQRIGVGDELVKNPNLALQPEVSAKILAAYFKDNGIARLASEGYFIDARTPINPDYQGYNIALLAWGYQQYIY